MKPLEFIVISDLHYYSKKVGIEGPEFAIANSKTPMDMLHSSEIMDVLADQLIKDPTKIVLLSGDITNNGEPVCHEEAIQFLKKLEDGGKDVYVITATHDFTSNGESWRYTKEGKETIRATKREELPGIYHDFSFKKAIAVKEDAQCYVAQLADGYRLFAINDDHNDVDCAIDDETMAWLEEQVADAKANGQAIISMSHHPIVSPSPFYEIIGTNDMMHGRDKIIAKFADEFGINFMFTGHTHMQDISYTYTDKGNVFYAITTASITGYPGNYRKAILDPEKKTLDIKTVKMPEKMPFEMKADTYEKHLAEKFFGMIRDTVEAAGSDIPTFARNANAISIKPNVSYKIGWIIKPFAKLLNKLRLKEAAAICRKETGLTKAEIADCADKKIVDIIIELVTNLYGGDGQYNPDTPVYKVFVGVCSIVDSILNVLGIKISKILKGATSVADLIKPLLFNEGICDDHATLDLTADAKVEVPEYTDTVKKSKKGLPIIIGIALVVIILLPIEIPYFAIGYVVNQMKYGKNIKLNKVTVD